MPKFGGIYPHLTEKEIKRALIRQIEVHKLHFVLPVFDELWVSKFWRDKGYDGKTIRQDESHPNIVYFLHDGMWRTGAGGKESDLIMRELYKMIYGNSFSVKFDYFAVRIGWLSWFKWNHKRKGNVRKLTKEEIKLYKFLKDA